MTTLVGTLNLFLQKEWTATPTVANIKFSEDWWNSRYPDMPQISISEIASPKLESYSSGGTLSYKYKPMYTVNVWQQIPRGADGTVEMANVEAMRLEVARVFRANFSGTATTAYGGSLSPFGPVLPLDYGRRLHELEKEPRMLRYEITLWATRDNE